MRLHGAGALDHARRMPRPAHQPVRRKWVWGAVESRLKAEALAERKAARHQILSNVKKVKSAYEQ